MNLGGRFLAWWDAPRPFALRALLRGEAYGKLVMERMRADGCEISAGRFYVMASGLEDEGLVTSRAVPAEDDQMLPRRVYALTPLGRETAK